MKILMYGLEEWAIEYVKEKNYFDGHEVVYLEGILNGDTIPEGNADADVVSIFVDSKVDTSVIDAFPNLKMISTRSTGFDHIDLAPAKEKGIVVASVPSYGENTVAEFAFAMLLALSRNITEGDRRVRTEGSFNFDGLEGFDLRGRTMGVLGTGRIGKHAISMAKGFGMNVLGFDAFPNEELAKELGFTYASFDEVLAQSDVITVHVPYMKETHHLVNKDAFQKMKKGMVLINTSRGAVVDTEALVDALKDGIVAKAGLDVIEVEDVAKDEVVFYTEKDMTNEEMRLMLANHILINMPNVMVQPHNAFNTKEAKIRIIETTADNIGSFIKGESVNVVK